MESVSSIFASYLCIKIFQLIATYSLEIQVSSSMHFDLRISELPLIPLLGMRVEDPWEEGEISSLRAL